MEIICPKCSASYEIPDNVLPPEGAEVSCEQCGSVFFAKGPQPAPAPAPTQAPAAYQQPAPQKAVPQQPPAPQPPPPAQKPAAAPAPKAAAPEAEPSEEQFAGPSMGRLPAGRQAGQRRTYRDDESLQTALSEAKSQMPGRWKMMAVIAAVVIAAAALIVFKVMKGGIPEEAKKAFEEAKEACYQDSFDSFKKAEEGFRKADELAKGEYPEAKAMLAQVMFSRGEYYTMKAVEMEKEYQEKAKRAQEGDATVGPEMMKKLVSDIQKAQVDASKEKADGFGIMTQFKNIATQNYTLLMTLADYYRIQKDMGNFEKFIEIGRKMDPESAIFHCLTGAMKADAAQKPEDAKEAAEVLKKAVEKKDTMLKARVKLAQAYIKAGDKAAAASQLDEILKRNPNHEIAALLKAGLEAPAPPHPPAEEKKEEKK